MSDTERKVDCPECEGTGLDPDMPGIASCPVCRGSRGQARAALAVPAGWKLVPVEPTQAMVEVGSTSINDNGGTARWSDMREAWADMLAAVPEVSCCPTCWGLLPLHGVGCPAAVPVEAGDGDGVPVTPQPIAYLRAAAGLHPWQAWELTSPDDPNGVPVFAAGVEGSK